MFNYHIICLFVDLMRIYLFVYRPGKRLSNQILQFGHSCHIGILRIIGVDNADEIFLCQGLHVIQKFFDQIIVVLTALAALRYVGEKATQIIDNDHSQIEG